jgi:hypothetical protein
VATSVVTVLTVVLFAFAGSIKLAGLSQSLAIRDHLGIAPEAWRTIGLLELSGAAGLLLGVAVWSPIGTAALAGALALASLVLLAGSA